LTPFNRNNNTQATPGPNESNTITAGQVSAWKAERERFGYEPWYDPRRGYPIFRAPEPDNLSYLKDIERLRPTTYIPADPLERIRKSEFERLPQDFIKFKSVLKIRRHVKVTKAGRVQSFSALVVIGNGNGVAGFGFGKGEKPPNAINRALKDAEKNLVSIQRYEDRTIVEPIAKGEYNASKVVMKQLAAGSGIRASTVVFEMCRCFGIKDLSCKIHGSHNLLSVVRAIWKVFLRQRHPMYLARATGKKYYDRNRIWRSKMFSHAY